MTRADSPARRFAWLGKDEAEGLRRTFRRLLQGEDVDHGLAVVADHAARHPDHPMVRWLAAWGPAVARDWAAGPPPPPFDPAAEDTAPQAADLDLAVCFVARPPGMTSDPAAGPPPDAAAYHALIRGCFAAARAAAPAMRRVLLTNRATALPDALGADLVVRAEIAPERLMPDRLRAYRDPLAATDRAGAVFVDPDVVVCRSPETAFHAPFSVGLTWRRGYPAMPINSGVLFARATPGAAWILDRALACHDAIAGDRALAAAFARLHGVALPAWYGDQVALAALAGWRRFRGTASPEPRRFGPGATLAFLPEDPFNLAVDPDAVPPAAELRRRVLVHFKGNAKGGARRLVDDILGAGAVDAGPATG
ncbi:MAG: hypothetical protein IT561_22110 [Alphaproteobacteria bacterium]|nr:hypothetical protein [Alphaproteobacteria bacterium]